MLQSLTSCRRLTIHFATAALPCVGLLSCVENSVTPVVFDQVIESTTFDNRLLAPLVIYRDGRVLDTLPARNSRVYPHGKKGVVRHAWQIIAPRDRNNQPAGIQPFVDLGIQYAVHGSYSITNESASRTIFSPRVANLTFYDLRLGVNIGEAEQFMTSYVIPANSNTPLDHVPYFYWHSSSNVRLSAVNGFAVYQVERQDTNQRRRLELEDSPAYQGAGLSRPIYVP